MSGLTIETIDLWLSDCQCQRFNSGQPGAKAVSGRKLQNDWQQTQPLATLGPALTRTVFCEPQKSFTGTILVCFFLCWYKLVFGCWTTFGHIRLFLIWYSCLKDQMSKRITYHILTMCYGFLLLCFIRRNFPSTPIHESSNPCFHESDENNVTWFYTSCFIFLS